MDEVDVAVKTHRTISTVQLLPSSWNMCILIMWHRLPQSLLITLVLKALPVCITKFNSILFPLLSFTTRFDILGSSWPLLFELLFTFFQNLYVLLDHCSLEMHYIPFHTQISNRVNFKYMKSTKQNSAWTEILRAFN